MMWTLRQHSSFSGMSTNIQIVRRCRSPISFSFGFTSLIFTFWGEMWQTLYICNKSKFFCFLTISYSISGLDRVEPDPREDFRDAPLNRQSDSDFSKISELKADQKEDNAPSEYCCDKCGSRFQKEGNLRIHMVAKHKGADHILVKEGQNLTLEDKQKVRVCQFCEQPFGSNLALENHITKKHKTCSICKTIFSEPKDMEKCRAKHTTCEICNFDANFPSKLKRHMQCHA